MPEVQEINAHRNGMSDEELLALIRAYELASLGSEVASGATVSTTIYPSNSALTTLEIDRYNALNAYLARPMGNEIENRSQVVLPTLRDTVNWMMPQLMRMFVGTKTVCRLDPESQDDEKQAEQETLAVNHVFMTENNGVVILHDYFWDALMMRNGYVEVYTKEEKFAVEERYKQLSHDQVTQLMFKAEQAKDKIDVLGQKEYSLPMIVGPGQIQPMTVFDLHIRRSGVKKKVCVTNLPPEEMRITPRAREGMEALVYSAHITNMTRSDLVAEGYDRDVVDSMAPGTPNWMEIDALARSRTVDELSIETPSDRATQEIQIRKVVMLVDYDGDGIAELRRVIVGGDQILENEVIEETPFVSGAPMRMPHRHTGMSMYDLVMDLQILSTNLWRQGIDNLMIANNTRVAVDSQNVNFDDLLSSRPGAPIRGRGPPQGWILPIEMPSNVIDQVIPALQYIDDLRSQRTGIGKGTMGLDADELQNVTKGGQLASMSAAALILELIARMLAEGVKGIFLKIHAELMRNQDKPLQFEVTAGKWVSADPSQWRRRTKVTPNVGLGSGNREEMRANVMLLAQGMQALGPMMVGPKQMFEGFKLMCESLGFPNPERFAIDPSTPEFQQHQQQMAQMQPPDPKIAVAKINADAKQKQEQSETQRTEMKVEADLTVAREEVIKEQLQHMREMQQDAHNAHRDRMLELSQMHQDLVTNLMKVFGPIEAAKVKAGADVTGQLVGADIDQAASAIEHNQTMVQQDQAHGHAMEQQSAQQEPEPKKPKRRSGKMRREDDGSYSFEMTDEE